MKSTARSRRPNPLLLGAVAGLAGYLLAGRKYMQQWGTRPQERDRRLPGDYYVPHPRYQTTRAISIAARPQAVWPWLMQLGQGRGGLYSYDWLENLFGLGITSVDRVVPELQHLMPGDTIRLTPEGRFNLSLRVAEVRPDQALVLMTPGTPEENLPHGMPYGSWAFVLEPEGEGTRLLARWRSDYAPTVVSALSNQYLLEPVHFLMERRMLRGIKERAESQVHEERFALR